MPFLTKQYKFCAAHRYWNSNWSDEKNCQIFGEDVKIHGHNYILEVSVTGSIDQGSGWLVDLKKLGQIVKNNVVNILDHSQIEKDIDWFKGKQPSSENILVWAWNEIAPRMEQGTIHRLRLVETHSIFTDYYGPEQ